MGFWVSFFVSLALMVVGELLRPKQKFDNPKPSSLGDFQFPTVDATRAIQVWWGTCKLKGPSVHWFGDLTYEAIRKKVKTGWFSSTTIIQGYKYYLGVDLFFGFGVLDEIIDFGFDDKSVMAAAYKLDHPDYLFLSMASPTLLDNGEVPNGVSGYVRIYKGTTTQPANDYTTAQWGEPEGSCFKRMIRVVLEHCYLGNSDTPPPPYMIGRRTPNPLGLTGGAHNINGDANAANMCYEVMTNLIFGMKISPAKIDTASFIACGNTLATEGYGLSMVIDTPMKGKDLLAEILRHVDGVIYADPQTGLYTMKLARDDYDVATIDIFDETNVDLSSVEFSRISWEETANTTVVNYIDRSKDFTNQPITYQDPANVFVRNGQIASESIDFLGFSNATTGLRAAARANKTRSSPLCRVAFNTNRDGYALRPSSVIKVNLPSRKINNLIVRVIEINYGTLDDPAVKVVATEDIFSVNVLAFDPPDTAWTGPGGDPHAVAAQRLEEAPHYGVTDDLRYAITLAARFGKYDQAYEIWSYTGSAAGTFTKTNETPDFTPYATLAVNLLASDPLTGGTLIVSGGTNMEYIDPGADGTREAGGNFIIVGNEWIAWSTMVDNGDGTYTFGGLYRAVLDTVPQTHNSGSPVWFVSEGAAVVDLDGYTSDTTVHAKFLTKSPRGTLDIASAVESAVITNSRSIRPLPPGNVQINGTRADTQSGTVQASFTLSWAHRNRNNLTVLPQTAASDTPEANQKYNVRFYNAVTNALIIQQTDMDAASAAVALAYTGNVRMELESTRDGHVSRVPQTATFAYDAFGTTVSKITPDAPVYVLDGGGA